MTESVVLSLLGGAAGVVVAVLAVGALPRVIPLPPLPPLLDVRVLVFTALLTLGTTLVFGLVPALLTARMELQRFLTASGRLHTARVTGRSALVVVQLAASLVLLVGAGLFIRSLRNVQAIDAGFDAEAVMIASIDARESRMSREQMWETWDAALERVRSLPGVQSAALGMTTPFEMQMRMPLVAPGYPAPDGLPRVTQVDFAGDGYFSTLGIEILDGRPFTADDHLGATPVAIVGRSLARSIWGGESPIGRCLRPGMGAGGTCLEVVGVAEDARFSELTGDPSPMVYRSLAQRPLQGPPVTVMHVRSTGDRVAVTGMVREAIRGVAPDVPFVAVRPIADLIAPQVMPWRIGTLLFGLFGGLGVALATVGLYGVLSFLVTSRTRELGVRIALGAQRRDVLVLVLGQGGRLIAIGLVLGALAAALATRVLTSMMYGISLLDPMVYVGTAVLLAVVGIAAVLVPARRAVRVDPTVALRAET
jgi:putative ABC transport system permease protein